MSGGGLKISVGTAGLVMAAACASPLTITPSPTPPASAESATPPPPVEREATVEPEPALPPQLALLAGLLPRRSIGADSFRVSYATYDGRGVIIGILDSGLDPSVPGLRVTTTGERKVLDLRDFSGEGRVALDLASPAADGSITVGAQRLEGFGRVAALARGPYYTGVFHERIFGAPPAADLNGDGDGDDVYAVLVAKGSTGWIAFTDSDGDGTLQDERPIRDFAAAGETLSFSHADGTEAPVTIAINLLEADGRPVLDLFVDNSGHGTHVAGVAAGHDLFGIDGFDGIAPGAFLLGLKIANNARGGISVTGSMVRALHYAADFARRRGLPLVLNLSFGVGNEVEGLAAIDSLIDEFALKHPEVLVVISAGNDGPGLSTIGFPGSAEHALSVCALFPGVFARPPKPGVPPADDVLGWWSARGGESSKPDVCAPGIAFSNVPRWGVGEEISGGTSMAAPQLSGAAALLVSGIVQSGGSARAIDLKRAIVASARPLTGTTVLDEGAGVPNVTAAYQWLLASHQSGVYRVEALPAGGNASRSSAAYRRGGLASPGDTVQPFRVTSVGGQPAARLLLSSDSPWVRTPAVVEPGGGPVTVEVTYDAAALTEPGLYVGTVWARPATDTIAGPSFGLTNTVIVPHALDQPLRARGMLTPGAVARYFVSVPEGSGGLDVRLTVDRSLDDATLYVFEPTGQPHRGGSSAATGDSTSAAITVASHDVVPGVYELVVVAGPLDAVTYRLEASLPPIGLTAIGTGPTVTLTNRTADTLAVEVHAAVIGSVRRAQVEGTDDSPVVIETTVPTWARTMVIDVALPVSVWHRLTDFGVTLFDDAGLKISDGPLNYAVGRKVVELDPGRRGTTVGVELFPAFAHVSGPHPWTAELRLAYRGEDERALLTLLGHEDGASLSLPPGVTRTYQLTPVPTTLEVPEGHTSWVEVRAGPLGQPVSTRRGQPGW